MISALEKEITLRYLKTRKKDGFLNIISIFSFIGISLGVAVLIIVMSVMNGFRTELINKIVGFNAHVTVKPYENPISLKTLLGKNRKFGGWVWGWGSGRVGSCGGGGWLGHIGIGMGFCLGTAVSSPGAALEATFFRFGVFLEGRRWKIQKMRGVEMGDPKNGR